MADVTVENHGTIFLFYPYTDRATAWIREWVDENFKHGPLAVEHRYAEDIAVGMIGDGLEVV